MKYDVLIKGGMVFDQGLHIMKETDIAIADGKIVKMGEKLNNFDAEKVIDVTGKMVFPGLIDSSLYPDTAFLKPEEVSTSPLEAVECYEALRTQAESKDEKELLEDFLSRGRKLFDKVAANGTTIAKAHVTLGEKWGKASLQALLTLKAEYADKLDIYTVVAAMPGAEAELEEAVKAGTADIIGANAQTAKEPEALVDWILELAAKYKKQVILVGGDSDEPDLSLLHYVTKKVFEYKLYDMVTMEGMSCLAAEGMDVNERLTALAWAAKVRLHICSLTTESNQLMDWKHRPAAPVKAIHDTGTFVVLGSGHVRDMYNGFGDGDIMSEILYAAHVHKYGVMAGYVQLMEMITTEAAYALRIDDTYGTLPGRTADLVVFDSGSVTDTVLSRPKRLLVVKNGKVVLNNTEA